MGAIAKTECSIDPYLIEIDDFLAHDTDNLINVVGGLSLSQNPRCSFEIVRSISTAQTGLDRLARRAYQSGEAYRQEIVAAIKHKRQHFERLQRGYALLNPCSSEEFETTLYWYAEQGGDRERILLQQIQNEPFCSNEKARRLLREACERIGARIGEPQQFLLTPSLESTQVATTDPKDALKQWINKLERINRRRDLQCPTSLDVFVNAIKWMAERGDFEGLDLLRQVRADPPYNSETIQKLFETAEERIHDRVYDPQTVVDREEAAYQEHYLEWNEKYAGEFIAIHRGQVIDHDADEDRLIERLDEKQRNEGRFRAYIVEIGAPVYKVKGSMLLGRQKIGTTEERS